MSHPVLLVGSMAFDDLDLPSGSFKDVVGGSATYGAFAASLYAPCRLVAVVGDDFPAATTERLEGRGVDTKGVERASGKTFRWAGKYSENLTSRETLDTQLNVFATFDPKIPAQYADSPFVLLGNIHPALQLSVLDQVKSPKLVIADTMNFWIEGEPKALAAMLARIDTLVINEEEARQISGEHNVAKAARAVRAKGPKRLIVKRGEYGALLFDDAGAYFAPAYPLETVVDPTGAGDSFAGGLMGYLAAGGDVTPLSIRRAIMVASACASFCVEAVGAERLATLTKEDVSKRLGDFRVLMDYGTAPFLAVSRPRSSSMELRMQTRQNHLRHRLVTLVVASLAASAFVVTACGEEEGGGPPLPSASNVGTGGTTGGEGGSAPAREREPLVGVCYPTDPFCGIVGSPCGARVDMFEKTKKILRLGQLQITKPKSLANNAVAGIVGNAMTVLSDRDRCHLSATKPGNFNFLIEVDTVAKTLYAGGGLPQKNPDAGYCYVTKTFASGIETKPVQIPIDYTYDEATDTGTMNTVEPFDLAVPIFDPEVDPGLDAPILLPLKGTQIKNALLTDQGSCIGRFRGQDGELDVPDCTVTSLNAANDDYYPFESGGDLTGYITVADSESVLVKDLSATLCALLSGQISKGKCSDPDGTISFGTGNKPDFDSDGDGENDAYLLAAKISGAGAKVNGACP